MFDRLQRRNNSHGLYLTSTRVYSVQAGTLGSHVPRLDAVDGVRSHVPALGRTVAAPAPLHQRLAVRRRQRREGGQLLPQPGPGVRERRLVLHDGRRLAMGELRRAALQPT